MTQTQPFTTESRTFTWITPGQGDVARLLELDGLGQLEAMIAGEMPHPPVMDTLGMTDMRAERGRVVVEMPAAGFHYNPLGTVHGGFGATLLDSATGCAVHSTLNAGDAYTTLELKINFLRPLTHTTGEVRGIGTIVHAGRTTALAEGRIEDAAGKLYAFATSTCLIRRSGRD